MSQTSEWCELIRKQGEQRLREDTERLDSMEAQLPEAISSLPGRSNQELLALLYQFHGSSANAREDSLRDTFRLAVETEILARMN